MKKITIFMNCHGEQIAKYLNQIEFVKNNYLIEHVSTYVNLTKPVTLELLKDCDILITNNFTKYRHYTVERLKTIVKPNTQIIVIEYFRFNGFYPLKQLLNNKMLLCYDESYSTNTYVDFINYLIDESLIKTNFDNSLKLLKQLNESSDIKIYDYFVENYKTLPLFRDRDHPTEHIFKHMVDQILMKLDINETVNIDNKLEFGIAVRYKIINENVKKVLGLNYKINKVYTFDDFCTEEHYFYFTKLMQPNRKLQRRNIFKNYNLYLNSIQ